MSQKRTETKYYGFKAGDTVQLLSSCFCEGRVIDISEYFIIDSFPPKSTKANKLVHKDNFDEKEFNRKQFVYGKTIKNDYPIRTYICNIKLKK